MKNLANLLRKADISPRERVVTLVQNRVHKEKNGKGILSESEIYSLSDGWKPKSSQEAREYNRYNDGWRTESGMKLDAQGIYLSAENSLLRAMRLVDYAMWKDHKGKVLNLFEGLNIGINNEDALDLIIENSGLVYDSVVHRFAFQSLSEDIQQDILTLCPDAETESQYLDQEELLAELFDGDTKLSADAKEKLVDGIIDTLHNKYAVILAKKGSPIREWWFSGYFAELPAIEIAKKWADIHGVSYEDDDKELDTKLSEKIVLYAEEHKINVRGLLKNTILRWLDQGLFVSEYSPIWNSDRRDTCNGTDTKLPHREVLKAWSKAKNEAKTTLHKLITTGELVVENREQDFYGMNQTLKILTGESLYKLSRDFTFAKDFKRQVEHLKPLGCLILFLRNRDFLNGYASLLAFAEIYKKLSRIYEIDLGYKVGAFIDNFGESIRQLNTELRYVVERLEESIQCAHDIKFPIEIFIDGILIHLEEIQVGTGEVETYYANEFKNNLGFEFG